jgi:hypothetical protein
MARDSRACVRSRVAPTIPAGAEPVARIRDRTVRGNARAASATVQIEAIIVPVAARAIKICLSLTRDDRAFVAPHRDRIPIRFAIFRGRVGVVDGGLCGVDRLSAVRTRLERCHCPDSLAPALCPVAPRQYRLPSAAYRYMDADSCNFGDICVARSPGAQKVRARSTVNKSARATDSDRPC